MKNPVRSLSRGIFAALAIMSATTVFAALPSGYTQREFIQGDGSAAKIVTDYTPTPNDDKIEAVVSFPAGTLNQNQAIWCSRGTTTTTDTWTLFVLNSSGYKFRFDYGSTTGTARTPALSDTDVKYTVTAEGNVFTWSGGNGQTHTRIADFTAGGPLMLFASYYNGINNNNGGYGKYKLYSLNVWRSGTLIHNLVPAVRESDSAKGLYDIKADKFYPGSGSFTMGDVFTSDAMLHISSSPTGIGSPSPAYGVTNGLAAGASFLVSCGATSVTNAALAVQYFCAGWKLYDAAGNLVSNGSGTSFTYTHPNPAEYRRLEWLWAKRQITDAIEVSMKIDAGGATADFTFMSNASPRELLLGYGTTDGGTDTNAWANVVKLADVSAGVTSLSNVALPAGCGTTWTVARAFLPREVTSLDYVQRGLILQYDAKENAGRGLHDSTPSVWKDLVGTNDLPLLAADSAEADAVLVSAGAHNTSGDIIGSYKPLMFEAYSKVVSKAANPTYFPLVEIPNVGLIGFRNQQSAFFIRCAAAQTATTRNSGQCYNDGLWNYDDLLNNGKYRTMSAYLKWGTVETARNCYANGSKISQKWYPNTSTDTMPSERNLAVGASNISNRFRSIRIYDRELTADEVAFNRAVDVARYEGGTFPTVASEPVYAPAPLVVERTSTVGGGSVSVDITFGASPSVRRLYVAYARTDAGMATNLYDGCDYVCDIAAGTTSATVTFPASATGYIAARGGYRLALEKPATADDYVAGGLVVQYDAKENAGRGLHDAAPSVWKDLVGANDLPFDSEDAIVADVVRISTNAHWTAGNVVDSYKPKMTFDTCKRLDSYTGGNGNKTHVGTIVAVPHIGELGYLGSYGVMETSTPHPNLSTGWRRVWNSGFWNPSDITGKWQTWTAYLLKEQESTTAYAKCYVNGVSKSQNTGIYDQVTWPAATELRLQVGGNQGGAYSTINSFRSIRIYDRELTADEVAFNRAVDVARYEGGPSPIFEWSDFVYVKRGLILFVR